MRGNTVGRRYIGPEGIERLRNQLSDRDVAIISQVAELRLMSALQIKAIHFPVSGHDNEPAASRACQRVLARLVLLPPHDPQFRRNRERVVRDAERENLSLEWDLGFPEDTVE